MSTIAAVLSGVGDRRIDRSPADRPMRRAHQVTNCS
jgi:hypothetical protein